MKIELKYVAGLATVALIVIFILSSYLDWMGRGDVFFIISGITIALLLVLTINKKT